MDTKNSKTNKVSVPELKPETKLESKSVSTPSSSPSVKRLIIMKSILKEY